MADHDGRKLSVREMINAHLFPVLALLATASSVSIAMSLGTIAGQGGDRTAIAANYCNGGLPNKPAR